jgi:hypothetical protein
MTLPGWEMQYVFPSQNYLRFVREFLLQYPPEIGLLDPFSIDVLSLPLGKSFQVKYVSRTDVEREISYPATRIVTGKLGSGKSSLLRIFLESGAISDPTIHAGDQASALPVGRVPSKRLMVRLSLAEIQPTVPEEDVDLGKSSLLTMSQLIRNIFNAYWDEIIRDDSNRDVYYKQLRQSLWWTDRLHWFYTHYKPYQPMVPGEFELMAWLSTKPSTNLFSTDIPPLELLRNLVAFVLSEGIQQETFLKGRPQIPFQGIQVLVDDLEILSINAVRRLVRDAQALFESRVTSLWFTLFADEVLIDKLKEMGSVSQGKIGFYKLPGWSPDQLKEMINLRLGFTAPMNVNFGLSIPSSCLDNVARKKLVSMAIEKAIEFSQTENSATDAPILVLRLLRGILSLTADRHYRNEGPISFSDLQNWINKYPREQD